MNDLKLPVEASVISSGCNFLSEVRRQEILDHLKALPPAAQSSALRSLVTQDTDEGRFVRVLLGKPEPARGESPDNKKISPPEVK